MSKRNPELLLKDILVAIEKIKTYTFELSYDDFSKDEKTIDAVIRNFEVIGEAARQLPSEYKEQTPQIVWYKLIGFRNRIVHEYFGVDIGIIWQIIENQIDELRNELIDLVS